MSSIYTSVTVLWDNLFLYVHVKQKSERERFSRQIATQN